VTKDAFPKEYIQVLNDTLGAKLIVKNGVPKITFEQFVEVLIKHYKNDFANDHWLPYHVLCDPCNVNYDYIIKMETLATDVGPVIKLLNLTGTSLPKYNEDRHTTVSDKFKEVSVIFSGLPSDLLTSLVEIFRMDFELFGYSWQNNEAKCENYINGQEVCC
jgi:hypothetical protein